MPTEGVSYTIDADLRPLTKGLRDVFNILGKVISKQERLQAAAEKASGQQKKNATATAKSFQQRVKTLQQAVVATQKLNAELAKQGKAGTRAASNVQALQRLARATQNAKLSAEQYDAVLKRFNRTLAKNQQVLTRTGSATRRAGRSTGRFSKIARDLESAAVLGLGPLSGLGARIKAIGSIAGRSGAAIVGIAAGLTGVAVAATLLTRNAIRVAVQLERIQATLYRPHALQRRPTTSLSARLKYQTGLVWISPLQPHHLRNSPPRRALVALR